MSDVAFEVRGLVPQAKGSKRGYVVRRQGERGQAAGAKAYRAVLVEGGHGAQDALKAEWAAAIEAEARACAPATPLDGPLALTAVFHFPRPKHETRAQQARVWHTTPIDCDKAVRAVCDPLKKAGVIRDDSRISIVRAEKRYAPFGEPWRVGVAITVKQMAETE